MTTKRPTLTEAIRLIGGLRVNDKVLYTRDGRTDEVTVQRPPHSEGSPESTEVTVGYGPGRFNTSVLAGGLVQGYYGLAKVPS